MLVRRDRLARSRCACPTPDRSLAQSLSIPRRRMDGRAGSLSMARQEPLCGVSGAPISWTPPCNTHARPDPASNRRSSGRSRSRGMRGCGAAATALPRTVARWQHPRASCDMAEPTAAAMVPRGALAARGTAGPEPCPVESCPAFLYLGGSPRSIARAVRRYRGWNRPRTVQSREAPVMPMRSTSIRTAPGDCDRPRAARAAGAPRAGLPGR